MRTATLHQLKIEGHDLIDEIVAHGIERNRIYHSLRMRLQVPYGKEHFSKMRTRQEVERAIDKLNEILLQVKRQEVNSHSILKPSKPKKPKPPSSGTKQLKKEQNTAYRDGLAKLPPGTLREQARLVSRINRFALQFPPSLQGFARAYAVRFFK